LRARRLSLAEAVQVLQERQAESAR